MPGMVSGKRPTVKTALRRMLKKSNDKRLAIRIRIHPAAMSRALKKIKARRGRPRPTVGCPWSKWAKTRKINQLNRLREGLKPGEVLHYCPNENRIERVWKDLHDQVTRNHRHKNLKDLIKDVRSFIKRYNRRAKQRQKLLLAA